MSEATAETETLGLAPPEPVAPAKPRPQVRGAGPADINEQGVWLIPRLAERLKTTEQIVVGWLKSALISNDRRLVLAGSAIGMCHVEMGIMGRPPQVIVDFVLSSAGEEGTDDILDIFGWMVTWAKGLGASGLYRVDDFIDCDRSWVRGAIGHLTRRQSYARVFDD